jgi:hypothetical protein
MTLVISKGITLRKGWQPMDADAAAYITAVETADTEPLEERIKIAIDNFVLGCKADGIWNAIKAGCILAGARTLDGALVPLVGTAPTNNNFVSGDYNRKTGLGPGSTNTSKSINSNRLNSADPQNSQHLSVYRTNTVSTEDAFLIAGRVTGAAGTSSIGNSESGITVRSRNSNGTTVNASTPFVPGFYGISRSLSSSYNYRLAGTANSFSQASQTPFTGTVAVYANSDTNLAFTTSRLAFYSIGESLDLALLDARVTDLINAFAAAIP